MTESICSIPTPNGCIICTLKQNQLVRVELSKDSSVPVQANDRMGTRAVQRVREQFESYVRGERRSFDLPLEYVGTPFQVAVWEYLQTIPFGVTQTYGQVAAAICRPKAVRAVGMAIGKNPLPVVIPCHRVVAATGLGGFSGGLHWKQWLLTHEGILT